MRVPYDVPKIHMYTRIRKSPYFYASRAHGVQSYSVCNRMYHPRHYDDPIAEYWKLVNDVTLWDVGVERQVEITGPDAFRLTNMLTPRDLTKCAVKQCKFVLNTDADGGIINNPVLLRLGENHFWLSVADGDVLLWAKGVASALGLNVTVREPDVAPMQIQGPKSRDTMVNLFGDRVLDLRYYWMEEFDLDGLDVVVSRTGYTGEVGYEIYLRNASRDAQTLWDKVLEAGRPHNISVIGPCQIRRVEAGILSYGSDIAVDNNRLNEYGWLNPYEVGLDYTVNLDKDQDFIGKEALKRIAAEGVKRKVVGIELEGDPIIGYIEDYLEVVDGDDLIGQVSSVFYSPRLEKNIGYAQVPIALADTGSKLTVRSAKGEYHAVVVDKPFVDPKKETPKL
ncbi:MAG: glycine cleavage system protein T [Actinobacteria bacterium]|nr:glycine cleavage system protein T [Actinomycetota bacterium]